MNNLYEQRNVLTHMTDFMVSEGMTDFECGRDSCLGGALNGSWEKVDMEEKETNETRMKKNDMKKYIKWVSRN